MTSVAIMTILLAVLALALLGYFAAFWLKERDRSNETAGDPSRHPAEPARTTTTTRDQDAGPGRH